MSASWMSKRGPLIFLSTEGAAHLYVVEATVATVFEVLTTGKGVTDAAVQRWIVENRSSWNSPKGYRFAPAAGTGV